MAQCTQVPTSSRYCLCPFCRTGCWRCGRAPSRHQARDSNWPQRKRKGRPTRADELAPEARPSQARAVDQTQSFCTCANVRWIGQPWQLGKASRCWRYASSRASACGYAALCATASSSPSSGRQEQRHGIGSLRRASLAPSPLRAARCTVRMVWPSIRP